MSAWQTFLNEMFEGDQQAINQLQNRLQDEMDQMYRSKLIGKRVHYRNLHEIQPKSSIVQSCRLFRNITGESYTILQMENGDEIADTAVYLES